MGLKESYRDLKNHIQDKKNGLMTLKCQNGHCLGSIYPNEICQGCNLFVQRVRTEGGGLEGLKQRFPEEPAKPIFGDFRVCLHIKNLEIPVAICDANILENPQEAGIGIITDPYRQKSGYATRAVKEMLTWLKENGVKEVFADVLLSNLRAQKFFTGCGFKPNFYNISGEYKNFERLSIMI